ncbi:MAG: HepT-like ribonuclease domain-containing protein [Planctomycetota bacterium]|jgi:uncharacterized protein with HEPN domain
MRNNKLYIKDILSAIESVEVFTEDMDFESFKDDDKTVSAVICKFEIIGEAAKNVPDIIKEEYSSIPWKDMAGMRDKLIHFYFGIDYDLVWKTIRNRLPIVKPLIAQILESFES